MSTLPHMQTFSGEVRSKAEVVPGSHEAVSGHLSGRLPAQLLKAAEAVWLYLRQGRSVALPGRRPRRMRVAEKLQLGDKRFVTILEVDGQSLLVGASGTSLTLLTTLPPPAATSSFDYVLQSSLKRPEKVQ